MNQQDRNTLEVISTAEPGGAGRGAWASREAAPRRGLGHAHRDRWPSSRPGARWQHRSDAGASSVRARRRSAALDHGDSNRSGV